uniref:Hamartin n=1 Tax=Lepeophtheirus salmonis TaxID=72036 RepID=A0A0K2U7I0_LEPSM
MEVDEIFSHLESDHCEVVQEVRQVIYDQFAEVKEPWLINGLYDYCCSIAGRVCSRHPCLELILGVREPHDKFLSDRLTESLIRGSSEQKVEALLILGHLIRKSPSWLYKITQMPLLKELFRLLRTENEIQILLTALLDLICLLPAIPSYITPFIQDLFEIFSHLTAWRHHHLHNLHPVHQIHLQSILLSYFHRLYGMFPCNFLHFLRSHYANQTAFFKSSIQPMLVTVRLHPLLVSHSREQEKSLSRWKRMELHDVLTESSRYALIPQEFNNEDVLEEASLLLPEPLSSAVPSHVTPLDESWACSISSENTETAIEATPETTPFVTPSKDIVDEETTKVVGTEEPAMNYLSAHPDYWRNGVDKHNPIEEIDSAFDTSLFQSSSCIQSSNENLFDFAKKVHGRMRYISFCDEKVGILSIGNCTNDLGESLNERRRKRYHSCPDPSKLTQMNMKVSSNNHRKIKTAYNQIHRSSSRTSNVDEDITLLREGVENSTQTDLDYSAFTYEHLFPCISTIGNCHLERKEVENPYLLLDKYLESACDSTQKEHREDVYKSIISSLRSQLLYERHRREILGERNRRLLGKSKSSRILKEENTALRDQLQLVKSEIDDLHRQIEEIRREKHLIEEERSFTARNRDHEIEKRSAEIRSLKISAQKSEEIIDELNHAVVEGRKELDTSRAQFFLMKAECEVLHQKESARMMTELELVRLRKELVMMGELQSKYKERLDNPANNMESETMNLFKQAYERDLQTMARALENKTFEVETFKCRITELDSLLSKKNAQILDHKKLIKRIQDENDEVLRESKSTYESMVQLHLQTESHVLELRDQLAQNTRILGGTLNNSSSLHSKKAPRPSGGLLDFHATRNVDIEQQPETFSSSDRSFVVGSPPLSSGGSIGSDKSEVMRRALESTRPIKFGEEDSSTLAGSSSSCVKDSFESSLNGNNNSR